MWKTLRLRRSEPSAFEVAACDLESRAARLAQGIVTRSNGNDEVVHAIAQFIRVLGRANDTATLATGVIALLAMISIITGIAIAAWQVSKAELIARDQTDLTLNAQFFGDADNKVVLGSLEESTPVLVGHGGKTTPVLLGMYLDTFENIDNAYEDGLLRGDDLCDDFSYYVDLTAANSEIQAFIADERKDDPRLYVALDDLHDAVAHSKDPDCREVSYPVARARAAIR